MTPRELEVLEWLIPALETYSILRIEPVVYTHRRPDGRAFYVTTDEACHYAAALLRKFSTLAPLEESASVRS